MDGARHTLQRGLLERVGLGLVCLPLFLGAAWLLTWTVELVCERSSPSEVRCVSHSVGFGLDRTTHVVVREPRGAHTVVTTSKSHKKTSSRSIAFATPQGEVTVPVSNLNALALDTWTELAAELDALARGQTQRVHTSNGLGVGQQILCGIVLLLMGLLLWIQGLSTELVFESASRSLRVTTRHYGLRTKQIRIDFDAITDWRSVRQRKSTAIVLCTRDGDKTLATLSHSKAAAELATLQALFDEIRTH